MNKQENNHHGEISSKKDESIQEINEILEQLPEDKMEIFQRSLTMTAFMQNDPETAISKKITEEHITKYLNDSGDNMRLSYKDRNHSRIFNIVIILFVLLFISFIIIVFRNKPEIVEKIIYAAGGFFAGGIGGFGYAKSKS